MRYVVALDTIGGFVYRAWVRTGIRCPCWRGPVLTAFVNTKVLSRRFATAAL